jgi:hypothetical protein
LLRDTSESPFERSIRVFVFYVLRRLAISRSVCILNLEVNGPVFWFCLVSMPAEPTTTIGFPPLNPTMGPFPRKIEFNPKPSFRGCVLALEKRHGIDLGDDFVGVPPRRFVPHSITATGSGEAIVNASKEFRLDWSPHPEHWSHDQSPRALETKIVRDTVGE